MRHTLALLTALLFAAGSAPAFELVQTTTEQRVTDGNEVVAAFPLSQTVGYYEPWDRDVLNRWEITAADDWWAVAHNVNGNNYDNFPSYAPYGWRFASHELHIAGESWDLPESMIISIEVGPSQVTAVVRKFSEQFKWFDQELTTLVLDRERPEVEPAVLDVDVTRAIQFRFMTKAGKTYSVQKRNEETGEWSTMYTVTGTGAHMETYAPLVGQRGMFRVTES